MTLLELMWLCPDCPPARTARALVLSESFWANVLYAALPFAITGLVIHAIGQRLDRGC